MGHCWGLIGFLLQLFQGHEKTELRGNINVSGQPCNLRTEAGWMGFLWHSQGTQVPLKNLVPRLVAPGGSQPFFLVSSSVTEGDLRPCCPGYTDLG